MTTTIMMMACQHLVPIFEVTKRPVHCVRANSATTIISPPTVLIRTAIIKQGFEVPFSVSQNHGRNGLDNGDRPWVLANIICHPVPWVSGCHYNGWWQLTYSPCHMLSLSFEYKKWKKKFVLDWIRPTDGYFLFSLRKAILPSREVHDCSSSASSLATCLLTTCCLPVLICSESTVSIFSIPC